MGIFCFYRATISDTWCNDYRWKRIASNGLLLHENRTVCVLTTTSGGLKVSAGGLNVAEMD
jgi:hypothetical protein